MNEAGLKARLGLFGATMVGVGAMVGAGIFVLCGVALRVAGPGAMVAFALNGVVTLITAFSFAELAATFPEAGGGYVFAKKVFPIGAAFAAGWVLWFAYIVAFALYALGFAAFLAYAIESTTGTALPAGFDVWVALVASVLCVGLLAVRGASAGNLVSAAKVVAFVLLIAGGLWVLAGRPAGTVRASFEPLMPHGMSGLLAAMGFTFIALEGHEVIAAVSEEIRDPARNVPRAMFLSIAITLVVYMGLLFVLLTVGGPGGGIPAWVDLGRLGEDAVAVGAQRFGGAAGNVVVVAAGLLSTFSAMAATLLAASRVSFAMSRDRALPRRLSLGGKTGAALVASGALAILVVLATGAVEIAGAAASLVFLVSFALANAAGLLVRARVGSREGFRAPLYPLLPLAGIASCVGLTLFQLANVPVASVVVLVWLGLGGALYAFKLRRSAVTVSARAEAFDADLVRLRGRAPVVLVPIANPARARPLVSLAQAMVEPGIGRVVTLTVAPYDPDAMDVSGPAAYARAEEAVREAVGAACELGRPFEGVTLLSPDVSGAIAATAAERRPEAILLGMSHMEKEGPELLQRVIRRTVADVVVLNAPPGWELDSVQRVLVPIAAGTPHNPLRARLLGMLLKGGKRKATILRVLQHGEERERAHQQLLHVADDLGLPPESCVLEEPDDASAVIVRHSADADLLVLGLGSGARRAHLIGDFARTVVGGAQCPVIAIAHA